MDAKGLVLGPVSVTVIKDLATNGRIGARTQASTDGQIFHPMEEVPELVDALKEVPAALRADQEAQRAETVKQDLERFRSLSTAELFGVAKTASPREYRQGFLELAKRYHPARLPRQVNPELLKACIAIFTFLTEKMRSIESQLPGSPGLIERTPVPKAAAPPQAPRSQLKVDAQPGSGNDWVVTIQVPPDDTSVFTSHKVANFNSKCLFVPLLEQLQLGARVQVIIRFTGEPDEIKADGKIIFENVHPTPREPVGMGIRLERLSAPDQALIQQRLAAQAAKKAATAASGAR
jgi:hypothetical protein